MYGEESAEKVTVIAISGSDVDITFTGEEGEGSVEVEIKTEVNDRSALIFEGTLPEDDVDRLYRLLHNAVKKQLAGVQAQADAEDAERAELPPLNFLDQRELGPIFTYPLVIENKGGRKKVLDSHANPAAYSALTISTFGDRREHPIILPDLDSRGDWAWMPGRTVHRAECKKVPPHIAEKTGPRFPGSAKGNMDGRGCHWEEIIPALRAGFVFLEFCLVCKPLGDNTKRVNGHLDYVGNQSKPPLEAPLRIGQCEFQHPREYGFVQLWKQLVTMTPKRWEAIADLVRYCVELMVEDYGELPPEASLVS
jgi:DNA-binding protein YbaB